MKYFIDTEFIEGTQDKTFCGIKVGETKPTIDLISIGIIAENGREYYAISKEFNLKEAWNRYDKVVNKQYPMGPEYNKVYWIRDNVLKPIFKELYPKSTLLSTLIGDDFEELWNKNPKACRGWLKMLLNKYGKTNKQIAEEVKDFVLKGQGQKVRFDDSIKFYGYYADYDWVVFCWLFGKMINLPTGFPMYCIDLKQTLDSKDNGYGLIPYQSNGKQFTWTKDNIKNFPGYPKQTNEHNSLADAHFNYNLYKFLQTI